MFFTQVKSLVTVLQERAHSSPDKAAYLFLEDGEREAAGMTYGELNKRASVVAAKLQEKNLSGQCVLLLYPPGPDFIVAFLGCLYAGVIAVPVAAPKTDEFDRLITNIGAISRSADISGILTASPYVASLEKYLDDLFLNRQIFIEDTMRFEIDKVTSFKATKISNDSIAYLQYTSGTISVPKGAIISHENLAHALKNTIDTWHYSKNSVTLSWAPHSHIYGLICGILVPLYHGSRAIIMSSEAFIRRPMRWLEAITKYRVSHSGSPNFGYALCIRAMKDAQLKGLDLHSWKVAINGGERVQYETLVQFCDQLKSYGFSLNQFCSAYGMSEATGTVAVCQYDNKPTVFDLSLEAFAENKVVLADENIPSRKFVSSGYLFPGVKAIVVDPESLRPVGVEEIGEIWLAGKTLVSGYWKNEDATNASFNAMIPGSKYRYFRTGDLGFIKKGELCLTGRLKEMVIVNGKKYFLPDLENSIVKAIGEQLLVDCSSVVFSTIMDEREEIIIIQEVHAETIFSDEYKNDVVKIIQEVLALQYGIGFYAVIFVKPETIPKTSSGKLQRNVCCEQFSSALFGRHDDAIIDIYFSLAIGSRDPENFVDSLDSADIPTAKLQEEGASVEQEFQILHNDRPEEKSALEVNERQLIKRLYPDFIRLVSAALNISENEINLNAPLSNYHLDSIILTQLVGSFNDLYQFELTSASLFEYATLAEFFNALLQKKRTALSIYYAKNSDLPLLPPEVIKKTEFSNIKEIPLNNYNALGEQPSQRSQKPRYKGYSDKDVAIIGMSGVFPHAPDLETFWNHLIEGKDAITQIPNERWATESLLDPREQEKLAFINWGGFIDGVAEFDAAFFNIFPREAELMDPQQRIFLQIVWKVIEDAGYSPEALSKLSTGVFVGVFSNDYAELLQKNSIQDAYLTTGTTQSILANRISYLLNLKGPSITLDTACSSSLVAIHQAVQAIHSGDCSVAIAGGVNLLLTPMRYLSANLAGMLSQDGSCKAFDEKANGYVRAEGAAAVLLKSYKQALYDGDHIYGVIKGTAVNHGGHVSGLTVPNPNAQAEVIVEACRRAKISVKTISYIEAHGTGTVLGDPIEINGLKKAFSQLCVEEGGSVLPVGYCGVGAVKTHIGHLESASGIAGVIKVLLALQHKQIPANLHFESLNPQIDIAESPFYIIDKNQQWEALKDAVGAEIPRRAGVSSFGFGGTNAHLIIEEAPYSKHQDVMAKKPYYLIAISAKTQTALQQRIEDLQQFCRKSSSHSSLLLVGEGLGVFDLANISYTLNVGRKHFDMRCALIVSSYEDLIEKLDALQKGNIVEDILINIEHQKMVSVTDKNTLYQPIFKELFNQIIKDLNSENQLTPIEYKSKLLALGNFYTEGYEVDWEPLYFNQIKQRVSLPSYPFARDSYWVSELKPSIPSKSTAKEESPIVQSQQEPLRESIYAAFKSQIGQLLKISPEKIDVNVSLGDLGLDSIMLRELAVALEKTYAIQINPSLFFTYNSIPELSEYLIKTYTPQIKSVYPHGNQDVLINEKVKMSRDSIAIVGMQGIFPQSKDLDAFWKNLEAEKDLIREVPSERWNWSDYYGDSKHDASKTNSKWGGFIDDFDKFDAEFFNISPREANFMDPQHRLFLEIVWKTIEDAGYDPFALAGEDVGLFVGVEFNEYASMISAQHNKFHGYMATGTSHALLANRVSYFFNFHGPSEVVDTACSSSLVAIHRAINAIYNGECSTAIAGGVSLNLDPKTFVITSQLGVLSPDGRCKTFDKSANGYVKGEGVAALLLKPLKQAELDGDHIYGVIKGNAVKHGGKAQSLTSPNAAMQSELLIKAYHEADISPDTVTYIEAHGTGTELGDPIEIEGLKNAFNQLLGQKNESTAKTAYCGIGSVKTSIGHLEPASGVAGLIKVLLSMRYGKLPANLHFKTLNPYIELTNSPFYLVNQTKNWERLKDAAGNEIPRRAGVSSFGFGGTMAHIIIEEMILDKKATMLIKPYYLVTLSAKTQDRLQQRVTDLYSWLKSHHSQTDLETLSFTLNAGRTHFGVRLALVVDSLGALMASLNELLEQSLSNDDIENSLKLNESQSVLNETYNDILEVIKNYKAVSPEVYREKLLLLGKLYTKSCFINWNDLHIDEPHKRAASLPGYPFLKRHYWFETIESEVLQLSSELESFDDFQDSLKETENDLQDFTIHYLKNIFSEKLKLPAKNIAKDVTYEQYGVDSLLVLEITSRLEGDFGALSKTLLYERSRLCDLADYFEKNFHSTIEKLRSSEKNFKNNHEVSYAKNQPTAPIRPLMEFVAENTERDVAIIGLSGTYPMAKHLDEFWLNLYEGRDCITEVPADRWEYKDYPIIINGVERYYPFGGFIPDIDMFDPLFFGISPREAAFMDPQERLFLQSACETLEDAGYTRKKLARLANNSVGVFAGVTYNFYPLFIAQEWAVENRLPLDIQNFSLANRISYFFNLNGPSFVVDTACSSSLAAIHLAYESIIRNECVMAIAGGVNLSLHPAKYHMLGSYGFLSDQGRCTSFGAGGNGYVPSEGVGSLLLKPLSLAIKDKDRIYGVIKGSCMNHGGKTSGYTVPNPNAQADLIKMALKKAQIDPQTISYIEAHGTGTSLGDPIEIRGLQEAFEVYTNKKQFCAIGSVKSNIGHLEAAAGISQISKVLLQMKHKQLVPSLHAKELNPYINFEETPFFVQQKLSSWDSVHCPRRAGVSSFGAGGTNVHMILEEPPLSDYLDAADELLSNQPNIFLLSAFNVERLQDFSHKVLAFLLEKKLTYISETEKNKWLSNLCYTSQIGRESMTARLAILVSSYEDLLENLKTYAESGCPTQCLWTNQSVSTANIDAVSREELTTCMQNMEYEKLAQYWVNGIEVPWEDLYTEKQAEIVSFPTYPFAKRRCWIPNTSSAINPLYNNEKNEKVAHAYFEKNESESTVSCEKQDILSIIDSSAEQTTNSDLEPVDESAILMPEFVNDWLYKVDWEPKSFGISLELAHKDFDKSNEVMSEYLIFIDEESASLFQDKFRGASCIFCFSGFQFERRRNNVFYINPHSADDYIKLFSSLYEKHNQLFKKIIYFPNFSEKKRTQISEDLWLASQRSESTQLLLNLFKALTQFQWLHVLQICFVTLSSQSVFEGEPIQIWEHHLWSLLRIFSVEYQNYQTLLLDLDARKHLHESMEFILQEIELFHVEENHIAYRNGKRYVVRLSRFLSNMSNTADVSQKVMEHKPWVAPEAVIITGGLGALGQELANWLLTQGTKYFLLAGKTALPSRDEWLSNHETILQEKIDAIVRLETKGAQVKYVAFDIADKSAAKVIIQAAETSWKVSIQGVFHLAGAVPSNMPIETISTDIVQEVLDTKIKGALVLHELFKNKDLNCFVLFSSLTALPYYGPPSLSLYAAADAFLNGLAAFRNSQNLRAMSISWGAWNKGIGIKDNHAVFLEAMGMKVLTVEQGMQILHYLLTLQLVNITVFNVDWHKFFSVNVDAKSLTFFEKIVTEVGSDATETKSLYFSEAQIEYLVVAALAEVLALEMSEVDPAVPFLNYGLDSIMGINFVSKLSVNFPNIVSPMDLYRYPTATQLKNYLVMRSSTVESTYNAETNNIEMEQQTFLQEISGLQEDEIRNLLEEELVE